MEIDGAEKTLVTDHFIHLSFPSSLNASVKEDSRCDWDTMKGKLCGPGTALRGIRKDRLGDGEMLREKLLCK